MDKYLKYFAALLFIGILGLAFLPIIDISSYELSLFDLMKIIMNLSNSTQLLSEIREVLYQYLHQYFILFGIAFIYIFISACLCLILSHKRVYIVSICNSIIINIYIVTLISFCYKKIRDVSSLLSFFNMKTNIRINLITSTIWFILHIFIIVISVVGIKSSIQKEIELELEENIPETFQDQINPWQNQQDIIKVENIDDQIYFEKQNKDIIPDYSHFTGAILGNGISHYQQVLTLEDRKEVYFVDSEIIDIEEDNQSNTLGLIYYVLQYQEYCIMPFDKNTLFLSSGQPLGKNRYYYLPRGTEIYVQNKKNSFVLC